MYEKSLLIDVVGILIVLGVVSAFCVPVLVPRADPGIVLYKPVIALEANSFVQKL